MIRQILLINSFYVDSELISNKCFTNYTKSNSKEITWPLQQVAWPGLKEKCDSLTKVKVQIT